MQQRKFSWVVVLAFALIATITTTVGSAGAANNNPPFEGYVPPPGYSLAVNGDTGAQVITDGDILTFELAQHAYNSCVEGPTTPGCLSNIAWSPWFDRTYVAPFGTGTNWGFSYDILDPENDCKSDSYTCTVQFNATSAVPCTGLPFIGNIAPLLTYVSGDLGLGFGSSNLPYVLSPRLYVDFGSQDCQPVGTLGWSSDEFAPLEIQFDASESYDPDNLDLTQPANPVGPGDGIVSYSWSFGDGAISFDPSPVHIYNEPGDYTVSITVTDDEGDIDIVTEEIQVAGMVQPDFTWSYPDAGDPYTVEFDGTATVTDGEIYYWYWDFGDGEDDYDNPVTTHTYAELGEVDVTLSVEDEFGGYAEITKTVDVGGDIPVGVPTVNSPFGYGFDEGAEGETTEVFVPIELSAASATPVTVNWETVELAGDPLAATLDVDYVADSGQIVIPPGEVEATIALTIIGDDIDEENEDAWIELTSAVGATIAADDAHGYAYILDDDDPPLATPQSVAVLEGDSGTSTVDMVVELDAPSGKQVTVGFRTAPIGSVIGGGAPDFVGATGTVTFEPGQTQQPITLTIIGDTDVEPGQLFGSEWGAVLLQNPTNATLAPGWARVGFFLIVDDDIAVS